MRIICCNSCGALYNQDVINFPDLYDFRTAEIIHSNAYWNGDTYVPKVKCICGGDIVKGGIDE